MSCTNGRSKVALMASVVLALCLSISAGVSTSAQAATSPYCNNLTLGGWGYCAGAPRTHYATYGWGDQHSVCIYSAVGSPEAGPSTTVKCTGGPGQGVYNPYGITTYWYPKIENNAVGSNTVHGVAYQP